MTDAPTHLRKGVFDPVASGPDVSPLPRVERDIDAFPGPEDLLDRAIADRMNTHLKARVVAGVEELRERVVLEGPGVQRPLAEADLVDERVVVADPRALVLQSLHDRE